MDLMKEIKSDIVKLKHKDSNMLYELIKVYTYSKQIHS